MLLLHDDCVFFRLIVYCWVWVLLGFLCVMNYITSFLPVLPTPGKIIRPCHQKNSAAGRKILPYPAAACMIIGDLCFFFTTIQTIFWRAVTQRQINVKSNVIQYTERSYILTLSFSFLQHLKKRTKKKFSALFRPFWQIFDKNSAANLLGRTYFSLAPFELCGRKFGQLATLISTAFQCKRFYFCLGSSLDFPAF